MTRHILIAGLLFVMPFYLFAQDDDMYFVPKKKQKEVLNQIVGQDTPNAYPEVVSEDEFAGLSNPDYHVGTLRDADEYNRRGHANRVFGDIYMSGDTLYVTEAELQAEDSIQQVMQRYEDEDYDYTERLVRFHGGVRSPYYWDYYYDIAYDPFFYDPWYYGPGYHGWYGYYYAPYYRHGWYGWYDPWYNYAYGWGGYYSPFYFDNYWGHSHHGHWNTGYIAHRSEASRYVGRRSFEGVSASRGMQGVSGNRSQQTAFGTRGTSSSLDVRTGGIDAIRRGEGTGRYGQQGNPSFTERGLRGTTADQRARTTQTVPTQRNQTTSRSTYQDGVSNQRATRQSQTTTTRTQVTSPGYSSSSSRSSNMSSPTISSGSRGGSFGGSGGFGGGSRGGSVGGSRGGR